MAITAQPMMSMTNFFINGSQYDESTIDFTTTEGTTEIWNITNQTMMAHPFHIHGNIFYVLQVNGSIPPANMRGRKDVVLVPPMGGSVKLITKYEHFSDADMPYMYHCHILSHEDKGMMGQFIVNPGISATYDQADLNTNVQILPNPAVSTFQVKATLPESEPVDVSIFDEMGRQIMARSFEASKAIDLTLNCNDWASGTYFMKIVQNGKFKTAKFVKQ